MSLSARVQLFLRAEVWGPKAAPRRPKHFSNRTFHPFGVSGGRTSWEKGFGQDVLAFCGSVGGLYRPVLFGRLEGRPEWPRGSHPPFHRGGRKLSSPRGSSWLQPVFLPPRRPYQGQGRGGVDRRVALLYASFAWDLFRAEHDKTVVRVAQVTVPGDF